MPNKHISPIENGECCCCLESDKLYPCEVENCSWEMCEKCYRKVYDDNSKCPACRNCIEYKIFTPTVAPIQEINISLDDLERGEIVLREPGCCLWYFLKCQTPCCEFYRHRENAVRCQCRRFENVFECFWKAFMYPVVQMMVFWLLIFLAVLIGRWVMWLVDPRFMSVYPYVFWLPFGWFILAGLLGLLMIVGFLCISSMAFCCLCDNDRDEW